MSRCPNFHCNGKIILFFAGNSGPLHSEACTWTLPILPTPLLRHWLLNLWNSLYFVHVFSLQSLYVYQQCCVFTPPPTGERSIVMSVSVCLCLSMCAFVCLSVRDHTFGITRPIFASFFTLVTCGRAQVVLWRRSDVLRTSGVMDDVMTDSTDSPDSFADTYSWAYPFLLFSFSFLQLWCDCDRTCQSASDVIICHFYLLPSISYVIQVP